MTFLRARHLIVLLALGVLVLAGCTGSGADDPVAIRIGAGSTVEQRVLAAVTQVAMDRAGIPAIVVRDLGDTVAVRVKALTDQIDVFWGYTGAAWTLGLERAQPPTDPLESFEAVQAADRGNDLIWVTPTNVNATLALFVRAGERPPGSDGTISWLAGQLAVVEGGLCGDADYLDGAAGYARLAEAYAISIDAVTATPSQEAKAVTLVASGQCYAAVATATSPTAVNAGLVPVIDDQQVFPAFIIAPVIRAGSAAVDPPVQAVLREVSAALDSVGLSQMNARVVAGEDPHTVAESYLDGG